MRTIILLTEKKEFDIIESPKFISIKDSSMRKEKRERKIFFLPKTEEQIKRFEVPFPLI